MTELEFSDAVRAHQDMLFRVAYTVLHHPDDCADAIQDALEHAWTRLDTLRDPAAFRPWLARIVVNCSRTLLCRRKAYTVPLSDDLPAAPPVDDTPLYEALASLNEGLRLPVAMYYLEGMSVREVAQALRLPQGTVKNRLMRARKKLAAILKEEE